jgi:anti-sigma factor RsiW
METSMNHDALKELLFMSYDREIPPEQQARVDEHLAACGECRAALADWKKTASLFLTPGALKNSEQFVQGVMRRIESEERKNTLERGFAGLVLRMRTAPTARKIVLSGAMAVAAAALFLIHPEKSRQTFPESSIEYVSDLMEGATASAENAEEEIGTAIEEYFL